MLKEAGLTEMGRRKIPKEQRVFVARERGNDELAPDDDLYHEFKRKAEELCDSLRNDPFTAHNQAFLECDYEARFRKQIVGDPLALEKLKELSARGEKEDVYLICFEGLKKACHRRILLRMCEEHFGAKVEVQGVEPKGT